MKHSLEESPSQHTIIKKHKSEETDEEKIARLEAEIVKLEKQLRENNIAQVEKIKSCCFSKKY